MTQFLLPYLAAPAAWLSVLYGVALGGYFAWQLESQRSGRPRASRLIFLVGGATLGGVMYVGCVILMWIFSWLTEPDPWDVLLLSLVFQSVAVRLAAFLSQRPTPRPPEPATVRAAAAGSSQRVETAGTTAMEWLHGIALLGFLALVYAVAIAVLTPPYREKMVLMLWLQPTIGLAALVEAWGERGARLSLHDSAGRVALAVILTVASYVGLRLHYGLPVLPI